MPTANYNLEAEEYVLPELRASFSSDEFRNVLDEAAFRYSVEGDRKQVLVGIMRDIYIGRLEEDEMAGAMVQRLEMPVEDALELYADVYADLLSDFDDQLEGQRTLYLDAHPEEFLPPKPAERDPYGVLADEVVAQSNIADDDERMKKRLYDIVLAHVKDVRDDAETRSMLMKPLKTGGMALDEKKASAVTVIANEAKGRIDGLKEEFRQEKEEYEKLARLADEKKKERESKVGQAMAAQQGFTKDDAKRIFAGSSDEREQLKAHVATFAAVGGPDELKTAILELIGESAGEQAADPLAATAGLVMLADSGVLTETLADEKFREAVLTRMPRDAAHAARQKILADPKSASAMSAFLQGLYRWVAGVSVEESARLGLRVVKALSKVGQNQYSQLVAFDADNGVFVWTA